VLQLYEARTRGSAAVIETERLMLGELTAGDAAFLLALHTDPDFIANIGDRGVHTLEDARRYIDQVLRRSYREHGFGLWLMARRDSGEAVGLCGLVSRDWHPHVEIGFALLPAARLRGYVFEAAAAVVAFARDSLRLERLIALTAPDNGRSIRVLERLGFRFERLVRAGADGDSRLFSLQFAAPGEWRDTPLP
jgi:RimJ/RimL family protein N-acetyltransferase